MEDQGTLDIANRNQTAVQTALAEWDKDTDIDENVYGIDNDGPIAQDDNETEPSVPAIACPLNQATLTILQNTINPLNISQSLGRDLFEGAIQLVLNIM